MARDPRPWYSHEKQAYFAYVQRRKVRLLKAAESPDNEKLAARQLRQILTGSRNDAAPGMPRVADVIDRYLRLHKDRYSERAFEERRRYLQQFAEVHGWRKVNDKDCLPVHVEEWVAAHPEWDSDWTKAQVVSIVLRPFNWAARKRLIPANPFRGVEKAQGQPRRPMTDAEFQSVLKAADAGRRRFRPTAGKKKLYPSDLKRRQRPSAAARFRQCLVFLRYTGCRPGELCGLEWGDIDVGQKVIVLRKHKTARKTRRPRVVPIHPVVLKLLIVVRRQNDPGDRVFVNRRKTPWNRITLGQRLKRAREAAGVPEDAKLYGLRHAFGTRAVLNGVDVKTLSELMGHTTTRMTEHYVHVAGQRAHLAEAMERVTGPSTPPSAVRRPAR